MKLILGLIALTSTAFASIDSTANGPLPPGFASLHVDIPASCSYVEIPARDNDGPYARTQLCDEKDLGSVPYVDGVVYRVVDGDTIHFYVGTKLYAIRMLGMDTPELHFLSRAQPTWGLKARNQLLSMVKPGEKIRAYFDKQRCDRYGRVLAHVYKGKVNLNYEMVKTGYAANYCIAPNTMFCNEFANAYENADREGLGFHRDRCMITPYVWRRGMQGHPMDKKVENRKTGLTYAPADYYKIPVADRIFFQN